MSVSAARRAAARRQLLHELVDAPGPDRALALELPAPVRGVLGLHPGPLARPVALAAPLGDDAARGRAPLRALHRAAELKPARDLSGVGSVRVGPGDGWSQPSEIQKPALFLIDSGRAYT
jgi:hypothetical protein